MGGARPRCTAAQQVSVKFIDQDGTEHHCSAPEGTDLLQVAWDHGIEMEGACEKTISCSTCHVYIEETFLSKVPLTRRGSAVRSAAAQLPAPEEDELDMLDLAEAPQDKCVIDSVLEETNPGLGCSSRLGCQVFLTKSLDGLTVTVPEDVSPVAAGL